MTLFLLTILIISPLATSGLFSSAYADEVIDTITVGDGPIGVAYNPDNGNMYVTNIGDVTVSVIDSTTNTVIETITVGDGSVGVAYNPDNGNMYVTNLDDNTVSVIDSTTNTVIDTITVGDGPFGVTHNPDNGNMYVTNLDDNTVSVIATISPIANAGPDQTVDSGSSVQLDGTGSSANGGSPIVNYQWTQLNGPLVDFDDPTSQTPTFTAPETEEPVNIVFQLVVTNEQGVESEPDEVTITVNPASMPPFEGILGSGNNINIQVQKNTGNNAIGQDGDGSGNTYSDQPIFQGQSTKQGSKVVS